MIEQINGVEFPLEIAWMMQTVSSLVGRSELRTRGGKEQGSREREPVIVVPDITHDEHDP
jgi:hypothetical protein